MAASSEEGAKVADMVGVHLPRVVAALVVAYARRADEDKLREWLEGGRLSPCGNLCKPCRVLDDYGVLEIGFVLLRHDGKMAFDRWPGVWLGRSFGNRTYDLEEVARGLRGENCAFLRDYNEHVSPECTLLRDAAAAVSRW